MFSAWMLGFLAVMAMLVWVAVVMGLPQPMLGLVILIVLVAAVAIAAMTVRRQRRRDRPEHRPPP